ncbi:MAG: hypothetical protein ACLUNZ_05215 [Evtepia sp.]
MKPNTNLTLADHRLLDLYGKPSLSPPAAVQAGGGSARLEATTTYTVIKRLCGKAA